MAATGRAWICRNRKRICWKRLAATHKPLVVVLTNGSALGVNWANDHANAILDAWYPGRRRRNGSGADALRKEQSSGTAAGDFLQDVDQLPPFDDYAMKGRTYRYFEGKPLYPLDMG